MSTEINRIEIDGSLLEGGGQVLRNAFGLSALLAKPIRVHRIRANRPGGGGLRAQHLTGIRLVADVTAGELRGAELNSREVWFEPGTGSDAPTRDEASEATTSADDEFSADTGTAGSVALLIQVSLPVLVFRERAASVSLVGGTDATLAPLVGYMQNLLFPLLRRHFALDLALEVPRRGFMPRGGGRVLMRTPGWPAARRDPLPPLALVKRGAVVRVHAEVVLGREAALAGGSAEGGAAAVATRIGEVLTARLRRLAVPIDTRVALDCTEHERLVGGMYSTLLVWAETSEGCLLGASAVRQKGESDAKLVDRVARDLEYELAGGGCVDQWMQDQLIVWMALARGESRMLVGTNPLTLHTQTAMHWASVMTGVRFEHVRASGIVRCEGIGYLPPQARAVA